MIGEITKGITSWFSLWAFSGVGHGITALMLLLLVVLGVAVLMYSADYFRHDPGHRRRFASGTVLFLVFSALTVTATHWLVFLICMELAALAVCFLVNLSDRRMARYYLAVQLLSASVLLVGIAGLVVGGYSPVPGPVPQSLLPFFLVGLGLKAGVVGLHFWLPYVHGGASSPASALLSGYGVKLGLLGLVVLGGGIEHHLLLATLGMVMAVGGATRALVQDDAKRLLAYSTISQVGFVLVVASASHPEASAAAVGQLFSHGVAKGLLFLALGMTVRRLGIAESRLALLQGGAARAWPEYAMMLLGAAVLMGLPGTVGYLSKSVAHGVVRGAEGAGPWWGLGLSLAGVATSMVMLRLLWVLAIPPLKGRRSRLNVTPVGGRQRQPRYPLALAGMALLSLGAVLPGLRPQVLTYPLAFPLFLGASLPVTGVVTSSWITPLAALILVAAIPRLRRPAGAMKLEYRILVDWLVVRSVRWGRVLQRVHTGNVRHYLVWMVMSMMAIALYLGYSLR